MIIGTGIDIIAISRFEKILKSKYQNKLNKIFSQAELEYCFAKKNPQKIAESLAVRFAAKEAYVKALGTGFGNGIYLSLIEIVNNNKGKPELKPSLNILTKIERILDCRNYVTHISLSNDLNIAIAQVIIEKLI